MPTQVVLGGATRFFCTWWLLGVYCRKVVGPLHLLQTGCTAPVLCTSPMFSGWLCTWRGTLMLLKLS